MPKSFSKLLIMFTMLIAFTGQAMAYHFMLSVDDVLEVHNTQVTQSIDIHSDVNSEDDCCDVECCEDECICPANACAAFVYLPSKLNNSDLVIISDPAIYQTPEATYTRASLLYRPPIFIS